MSFQLESTTLTTFRARPPFPVGVPKRVALRVVPEARMPKFPVSGERASSSWFSVSDSDRKGHEKGEKKR